jgi:adenosylcobinamide-phosphate synthase
MIVGRNPDSLDEAGVARAAIESLAENFADGIVAPAFWMAVAGLPGAVLYKAANTADSMIGHRNSRYAAFGWAAARLDDGLNLPASRLAAMFIALAAGLHGGSFRGALQAVRRDAARHRSPNAGWPEAAMAGALGLQLAGPRVYGDELVDDAFMGDGRRAATAGDIRRALGIYRSACAVQWLVVVGLCLILRW